MIHSGHTFLSCDLVALAFFIAPLIDSGGNASSQAAAMMIRALVIGEIHLQDWAWTLFSLRVLEF